MLFDGKRINTMASMVAMSLNTVPIGEALMTLSAAKKMVKERIAYVPTEPHKPCPVCDEVAGYGAQGWACTNPVCEWMESFEED